MRYMAVRRPTFRHPTQSSPLDQKADETGPLVQHVIELTKGTRSRSSIRTVLSRLKRLGTVKQEQRYGEYRLLARVRPVRRGEEARSGRDLSQRDVRPRTIRTSFGTDGYTSARRDWSSCVKITEVITVAGSAFLTMCERSTRVFMGLDLRSNSLRLPASAWLRRDEDFASGTQRSQAALKPYVRRSVVKQFEVLIACPKKHGSSNT